MSKTPDETTQTLTASRRNRRIVVCGTALVCLIAADWAVRCAKPILDRYDVADYDRKPSVLRKSEMPDVVLMGSSRTKYALVPAEFERVLGVSTYNLGIAGSKVVEWIELSRELFAERRPKLVVLGINASEIRADYVPTSAARHLFECDDLIESMRVDGVSLDVIGAYARRRLGPIWAAYNRRYELKMWGQELLSPILPKYAQHSRELRERVATPVPPKGYDHPWAHGRQMRDLGMRLLEDRAAVVAASVPKFAADSPTFQRLDQLLSRFEAAGIRVVVAYVPNSPETETRWAGVEPQMIDRIETVCRRHGLSLLRCDQTDIPRSNHDFLEEIHVGLPLARQISRRIAKYIADQGLLTPQSKRANGYHERNAS